MSLLLLYILYNIILYYILLLLQDGWTALYSAASSGKVAAITALLEAGADANTREASAACSGARHGACARCGDGWS